MCVLVVPAHFRMDIKFKCLLVFEDLGSEDFDEDSGIKTIIEYKYNDDGKKVKVCSAPV